MRVGLKPPAGAFDSVRRRERERSYAVIDAPDDPAIIAAAASALERLDREGPNAALTARERTSLEAVDAIVSRPVIAFQPRMFDEAPARAWRLRHREKELRRAGAAVGRVEIVRNGVPRHVGTSFLIGERLALTNRHVVTRNFGIGSERRTVNNALQPRVDFNEELASTDPPREFAIEAVHYMPPLHQTFPDLAVLRLAVRDSNDQPLPEPLQIVRDAHPRKGTSIVAIGYPSSSDGLGAPEEIRRAVFQGRYAMKCLMPGKVLRSRGFDLWYDSSTLAGNSGSCLIEIASGAVLGLHYGGCYKEANWAVPLWKVLASDPEVRVALRG